MIPVPRISRLLAAGAALAASGAALAALSSATLQGRLLDERGRPLAGAQVILETPGRSYRQTAVSDPEGRYRFHNLPFNTYHLEAQAPGMDIVHRNVELRTTLPVELDLRLATASASVAVEERLATVEDHPSSHVDVDRTVIERIPAAVRSRAMESVLLTTPGFVQDENGRFHFRGSHGQVTYVVDGIPISDQMQATFSNSLDPSQAESMEVITGGVSAEYGGKPVAVVNLTTKTGLGASGREGDVFLGLSRFSTREAGFSLREDLGKAGYFINGAASSGERFLDPVNFENFHNSGETQRLSGRFDWLPTDQDTLRLSVGGGHTRRDVVNLASQQAAGQNQRMGMGDLNLSLAWTHLFQADLSLDASVYYRRATAALRPTLDQPSAKDTPVWVHQDRDLENLGVQAAVTRRFQGGSTLKAGLQVVTYPLQEDFRFAITRPEGLEDGDELLDPAHPLHPYTPEGGSVFHFHDRLRPSLASAYLQNDLHLGGWFLAAGLRYDRYQVKDLVQAQLQPRLGLSYRLEPTATVFRASYDRLLITPDNENLALSLSQAAWDLGPRAGTPVPALRPELQDSFTVGAEQELGRSWRLMAEYWEKRSRNAADSEQFLNTGILFPIAADRGLFHGMNLRLELLRTAGFSGTLSLGRTRAIFQAPTVGGLQLETPEHADGERFLIDHDQKLVAQLGVRYEKAGSYIQVSGRHDSGLVAGDPDRAHGNPDFAFGLPYLRKDSEGTWRIRPRTTWDLGVGRQIPLKDRLRLQVSLDLLNATDERALYNFMSAFGGTHVVPPRTLAGRVKLVF
jgi:hypothetical protein